MKNRILYRTYCLRFLMLLAVVWIGACSARNGRCIRHADCEIKERCNATSKKCEPGCASDLDCKKSQYCDVGQRICKTKSCPFGGTATSSGCLCQNDRDCISMYTCRVAAGDQDVKRCIPLCHPGEDPDDKKCVCPAGWSWSGKRCRKDCPQSMKRGKDGYCTPVEPDEQAAHWDTQSAGLGRLRCPRFTQRSSDGTCTLKSIPRFKELKEVGPQKACPRDPKDKWDEGYIQRTGLPKDTPILFVDAAAPASGANGSKKHPFKMLSEALVAAPKGSVVLVAPGQYKWGQRFSKPVHLIGRCTRDVQLNAAPADEPVGLTVATFDSVVEGFSLLGSKSSTVGIVLSNTKGKAVIRHVQIHGTHDIGIRIESQEALISHVAIQSIQKGTKKDAVGSGIYIRRGSKNIRVEHSSIQQCALRGVWITPPDTTSNTSVELAYNMIFNNARHGVEVTGKPKRVQLIGNNIYKNGLTETQKGGVWVDASKVELEVKDNRIESNRPHGIVVQAAGSVKITNNILAKNERPQTFSVAAWIVLSDTTHIQGNHITSFGSVGVAIEASKETDIVANWIEKATLAGAFVGGIYISPLSQQPRPLKRVNIESNIIEQSGENGIYSDLMGVIEIRHNIIRDTTAHGIAVGVKKRGFSFSQEVNIAHNDVQAGEYSAISVFSGTKVTIVGNAITPPTKDVQRPVDGIVCLQCRRSTLSYNRIQKLHRAIYVAGGEQSHVERNRLWGHETKTKFLSTGILLHSIEKNVAVTSNQVRLFDRGAALTLLQDSAVAQWDSNVWFLHRALGVFVQGNKGRSLAKNEIFEDNAGRHVSALNNVGFTEWVDSTFVRGRRAPAQHALGLSPSEGMGVHVGSMGLTRWVYSKAKIECPDPQRPQTIDVGEGWIARLVRVPHALDVCQKWEYSKSMRTQAKRLEASACQTCYAQKKGCRWIWSESGEKSKQGKGIGSPSRVECVPKGEPDSCTTAPSGQTVNANRLNHRVSVQGQCRTLQDDPCDSNTFCGTHHTNRHFICSRSNWSGYGEGRWDAYCTLKERSVACPAGQKVCADGQFCVESEFTAQPMDVHPSGIALKRNVFWDNAGPDIVLDQAGQVSLEGNLFFFCTQDESCASKKTFRRILDPQNPGQLGWKSVTLPKSLTILWQHPSPYKKLRYKSDIFGKDLKQTRNGLAMYRHVDVCNALDMHAIQKAD